LEEREASGRRAESGNGKGEEDLKVSSKQRGGGGGVETGLRGGVLGHGLKTQGKKKRGDE